MCLDSPKISLSTASLWEAQPSGSINSSRIRNFQVEVDVYPLPAGTTYTYDLNIVCFSSNSTSLKLLQAWVASSMLCKLARVLQLEFRLSISSLSD
jgi:hypothetical protein